MKKTLGGDRLGSGKKMEVELHGYGRSTHDLGYIWRSTMAAGTLVPFMSELALPGDTFDIDLDVDIKTHPTIGPLFGSYKVQLDIFQAPIRLYQAYLHNNQLGIGMKMSNIKLPQLRLEAKTLPAIAGERDIDNAQINPSALLSYLGIRGVGFAEEGMNPTNRNFNGVPMLAYWEIYKNYYANKQETYAYYIHSAQDAEPSDNITTMTVGAETIPAYPAFAPARVSVNDVVIEIDCTPGVPTEWLLDNIRLNSDIAGTQGLILRNIAEDWTILGSVMTVQTRAFPTWYSYANIWSYSYLQEWEPRDVKPSLKAFELDNIDNMRGIVLQHQNFTTPLYVNFQPLTPYSDISTGGDVPSSLFSQEMLAVKTYQSDLFNNWLSTEWIDGVDGITAITAIDTSDGSFTIDTLNLSKKVYDMLNRIAVSGGSYDDWIDAVYTHDRYVRAESPIYHGGLIRELVFQEVVSNAQSTDGQPLGTLAGKGIMSAKRKGGKVVVHVDEPSYIMGIISLTPRVDYSQGNKWDTGLKTMDDLHKPALDEIGFQELITEQMAWWDTEWNLDAEDWVQKSAGKQPAWINYMTNYNRTYGNFAVPSNEMFMTLNRRYEWNTAPGEQGIKDLTTYIDPGKFNFIFAETAIDAQNFWAQIAVDITARRKMSAKVMPNL